MDASEYFQRLTSRSIPVVLDDESAAAAVAALGFPVVRFNDYDFLSPQDHPALCVISEPSSIGRLHALWRTTEALFCHLSLAKFDGSAKNLSYAFERLLSLDHAAALARRAETYDRILSCQDLEIVTAAGILRCHMKEELEIPNPGTDIEPGWLYSIAEFFEASVVNLEGERSSFWVEGELACDAFIYLCNSSELKARYAARLDELLCRIAAERASLRFADNRLARITVGGDDVTSLFMELTEGKERESAVTELGIGCAEFRAPLSLDRNVVLHKSGLGAYVGIGKGLHLPHIDFIAAGAEIRYSSGSA